MRPLRRLAPFLLLLTAACARPDEGHPPGRALLGDVISLSSHRLRLAHIDAPEAGQLCLDPEERTYDCGEAARRALARMTDWRVAECRPTGRVVRRLSVAECEVEGAHLSLAMARAGWAVALEDAPARIRAAEAEARRAGRGLWAGRFAPPRAFRAALGDGAAARPPRTAGERCRIKGNVSGTTRIYHLPGDPNYPQVVISPEQGERWFCSEREAIAAGWRGVRR